MAGINTSSTIKEAQIQAVVIRANGTREDLGTISYYHRNVVRRWFWRLKGLIHG